MSKHSIPHHLYQQASQALKDKYYYERPERFALRVVAESGRHGEAVEKVYINAARAALLRHPVVQQRRPLVAAQQHVHVA